MTLTRTPNIRSDRVQGLRPQASGLTRRVANEDKLTALSDPRSASLVLPSVLWVYIGCSILRSHYALLALPFSLASLLVPRLDAGLFTRDDVTELDLPSLTLQAQQPNFNSFDLTSALPPAYITSSEGLQLPSTCGAYVGADEECTSSMTSLIVHFEDCGTIFVLAASSPRAYTLTTGETHFFGDCRMNVWVHEMTHAFDFARPTRQTLAPAWQAALAADSCAPDTYSLVNEVEDFAQVGVLTLAFMLTFELYNPATLFGNDCDILDTGPPGRHTAPPAELDPSRSFHSISANDSANVSSGPTGVDGGPSAAPTLPSGARVGFNFGVYIAQPGCANGLQLPTVNTCYNRIINGAVAYSLDYFFLD
ncbi:hypothetical protein DFH06DRAFT_1481756 [Mycena polygramma]|nr:hypothetical protein DFH06DRAFT_1481756 [Mycena polygramma]